MRMSSLTPPPTLTITAVDPSTAGQRIGTVTVRPACRHLIDDNLERIVLLYATRLRLRRDAPDASATCVYDVHTTADRAPSTDLIVRLQRYIDELCVEGCKSNNIGGGGGGEDSSYDSDYDDYERRHQDVSRTTSDTLAAEYADYVDTSTGGGGVAPLSTVDAPGYTARVEFALKLGYTERLVQTALIKLGPTPAQNELLAELIKLGAQKGGSIANVSNTDGGGNIDADIGGHDLGTDAANGYHLRPIVVDGSNVAMSHGNKEIFSCRGIKICVDWFRQRGHRDITVFVPKWRKEAPRPDNPIRDQEILAELERERVLVFTPSRLVGGKRTVCYDDRYILRLAAEVDGVVVSNDNYRDLCQESAEFRRVVEERVLMYSFVNDRFMPPDDPLGRAGPTLENFLRADGTRRGKNEAPTPPPCPYGKKCTYGNKCKYHHPERGPLPHKSVTERLSEHAQRHLQARAGDDVAVGGVRKTPLGRTRSNIPTTCTLSKDGATNPHAIVAKSRSVDNVGGHSHQSAENLHRKLHRQLTLNPGADPRLIRRYLPPQTNFLNWNATHHQHVTRIASAPDSYRPWPPGGAITSATLTPSVGNPNRPPHMQRMSSCSDPQLNVWPIWSTTTSQGGSTNNTNGPQPPPAPPQSITNYQEDARRNLHYHLSAIFPEEQVMQAMQMYPDETNPQKICAAILSMFPKT